MSGTGCSLIHTLWQATANGLLPTPPAEGQLQNKGLAEGDERREGSWGCSSKINGRPGRVSCWIIQQMGPNTLKRGYMYIITRDCLLVFLLFFFFFYQMNSFTHWTDISEVVGTEQRGTEARRAESFTSTNTCSRHSCRAGVPDSFFFPFFFFWLTNDHNMLEKLSQIMQHVTLLQHVSADDPDK